MKLLCLSCSNVLHKKTTSASTRVCKLAEEILQPEAGMVAVETVQLMDYELRNCVFCGGCLKTGTCIHDEAFNELFRKIAASDRVLLVVPFYSVIPSKLTMVMEKINQVYYTAWLKKPDEPFLLKGKKVAVIAHGGSVLAETPSAAEAYRNLLLKPLTYSLSSFGMDVVSLDEDGKGVVFGVEGYDQGEGKLFPDMVHDWEAVRETVTPLVMKLMG